MKKTIYFLFFVSIFSAAFVTSGISSSFAGELPKVMIISTYKVGALGFTFTSAFREAIEQKTPMKVRCEPYDTDVDRVLVLKNKEGEISLLTAASAVCASYGIGAFDEKKWGPQPLFQIWRGSHLYFAMVTRGDSGIRYPEDMKGRRIPYVPSHPAGMGMIEGSMAWANLTWDDVTKVPMSGFVAQARGVLEGVVDVAFIATATPIVKEIQASPHKAGWVLWPHNNKEGWSRLKKRAPWFSKGVCKKAPGLERGMHMEIAQFPYSLWAYDHTDPNIVYTVVKAMDEGYGVFKKMHKLLPKWTLKQAVTDPSPVPYHEGAIRYFKEKGVWTAEMDKWQSKQMENFQARAKAFKK
jgi:TRAP transporter TAXI family solute receptor